MKRKQCLIRSSIVTSRIIRAEQPYLIVALLDMSAAESSADDNAPQSEWPKWESTQPAHGCVECRFPG
jgi:hypothetical protein